VPEGRKSRLLALQVIRSRINNTRQVRKLVEKGKELGYAKGALLVPAGQFPVRDD